MDRHARSIERAEGAQSQKFNAPLFRSLVEALPTRNRWVVLDLGAAHTETISLFAQYRCRLDIADLADGLDELNVLQDRRQLQVTAEALLPSRSGEATDLVLCWDLLNYLERPALSAVMSCVAERSRRNTLAHALIVYSDAHMPSRPGSLVPLPDLHLVNLASQADRRPAPRYSPGDLSDCLPGYVIERAMLLGNGMQEFLFRL